MENNTAQQIDPKTLTLDFHKKVLVLKALNISEQKKEAAEKLGISTRQLYNLIEQYNITKVGDAYISI